MTRRQLLGGALTGYPLLYGSVSAIKVPVLRLLNRNIGCTPAEVQQFYATVWDEAIRDFRSGGVELRTVQRTGEVRQYPGGRPRFLGLERKMLNVVLTDTVPLDWDNGRALPGVTTIHEGYHLSVIALKNAYANRLPFLAVNTVVHELLHVFRGDIFVRRAGLLNGIDREAAVDWQATQLWLFGEEAGVRKRVQAYVQQLVNGT
jgi:hypothetical protein